MGCAASKEKRGDVILPSGKNDGLLPITPTPTEPASEVSSEASAPAASRKLTQGHHWAEGEPGKERRVAKRPWDKKKQEDAIEEDVVCDPCDDVAAAEVERFEFSCSFPMMVMKMETFMSLKIMRPYEELIKTGDVFEWTPDMGRCFFMSHQWTSFSHPDPQAEQLTVAQTFLSKVGKGQIRSLFATEEEWLAFHYKEANRFLQFDVVTEEQIADDVSNGYVWLDYASVPQAVEAEEARLRAIDSIPFYVDHALCFLAIVPKIEHKDLPGTFCTYKSWMERGWCRLETQVHELRLFIEKQEEFMPGIPAIDLPRRPLIVHSGNYATTYDMMDNFYMLWQRKSSVFTGEFACCRLGHKRKGKGGELINVTCDKTRIRPLVKALWDRKIAHLAQLPPFIRWLFHWRWASHSHMMMSDFSEDVDEVNDQDVSTLEDMVDKYLINDEHIQTFNNLMPMFKGVFQAHPSFQEPADTPISGGGGEDFMPDMMAWLGKWIDLAKDLKGYQLAWAVCFAVAEGNLRMLEILHKEYGADLTLGYSWGITLLDFASGKGHVRIIDYLVKNGAVGTIDKPSFRERITAIDRACKAGFVDALDKLVELGAKLTPMRLNRQVPAHGAAIMGHTHVLKRLHELGADVIHAYDSEGKSPLDYATYFCHKEASEFLREIQGGKLTRHEEKVLLNTVVKMQSLRRGNVDRMAVMGIRAMAKGKAAPKTAAEEKAAGMHM